jgi:hypothetical protein
MVAFKTQGVLDFFPENKTKKHFKQEQVLAKKVCLITTTCDLHSYYRWFIKTRFNLFLNPPLRGTHVTIINDIIRNNDLYKSVADKYQGKKIDFYYEIEPRSNSEHWWLRVFCPQAENIRGEMGISRIPYFTFHLTLGLANEKSIEHSKYILDCCKRFELISNTPRMELEDHIILT